VACAFGKIVCDIAMPSAGGPAHRDMKDWLNHTIDSVRGSNTLLLIKPHPHEVNNEIGTFLTEHFQDLIEGELPHNVIVLGHRWFNIKDMLGQIDLGVLYNGTTAVELGVLGIPAVLCSDFGVVDYPVGHAKPKDRMHYRRLLRFEEPVVVSPDLKKRSIAWLHCMSSNRAAVPYRYHEREITNKVVHLPTWFKEDIEAYLAKGDPNVRWLAERVSGGVDPPPIQALDGSSIELSQPMSEFRL
jgi:capsular polysaccharide export protein